MYNYRPFCEQNLLLHIFCSYRVLVDGNEYLLLKELDNTFQRVNISARVMISVTIEPTVFESMALAHARVRQVVYRDLSLTRVSVIISAMSVHAFTRE
jgi:hypothetical protein